MTLATLQRQMLGAITATGDADDTQWLVSLRPGLFVYRNAYRARLIECMRATYPRCLAWAGEEPFDAAASHHVILNPPQSWTLDTVGDGFATSLRALFPDDLELSELAWLEWTMGAAFTASDRPKLDAAAFAAATANYNDEDWGALTFAVGSELRLRTVAFDVPRMWATPPRPAPNRKPLRLKAPASIAVWRKGMEPQFRMLDEGEDFALKLAESGASFAEICAAIADSVGAEVAAQQCGTWLGRWIETGILERIGIAR